jgi:hypothetical protein
MGVRAGHGHKIKDEKDLGGRRGGLDPQDHVEEGLGDRGMEAKFAPVMAAFLV